MKKFYFSALALMVLAASCTNEQLNVPETTGNAINFGTYIGRDVLTRASVFATDDMKTDGFGVFASYTGQNDYSSQDMNFMKNQKVTYDADKDAWTYSPVKYWPNNVGDKVSFFAYAPYAGGTVLEGTKKLVIAVDDLGSQDDLVVADAIMNQTKQGVGDKVTFEFKHALSRIGLNVEAMVDKVNDDATGSTDNNTANGALASETTIKVTEVKLIGKFDTSADIDLSNSTWDLGANGSGEVTYTWNSANFTSVADDNVTTEKTQLNKDDSYAMIIPQDFVGENKIKLVITYTVTTSDEKLNGGKSEIKNIITSDPFNFNFEQGKAYMFNLHLGMTSVKLSANVSGWDETSTDTVVNLPINNN